MILAVSNYLPFKNEVALSASPVTADIPPNANLASVMMQVEESSLTHMLVVTIEMSSSFLRLCLKDQTYSS